MRLHDLKPAPGSRKSRKRVGRGPGSGLGKTAGRGEDGAKSRSGYSAKRGFEGGQMPLHRRMPKRGFKNIFRKEYRVLNVSRLNQFEKGTEVTPELLLASGMVRKGTQPIKILGNGDLTVSLTVKAHRFTATAAEKIEKAGGKVERLS